QGDLSGGMEGTSALHPDRAAAPLKLAATAVAAAVVASAHASALPPPSFRLAGYPLALSAAGARIAVATSAGCTIRVTARGKPVAVGPPAQCRAGGGDVGVDGLWLGRSALAARTVDAPRP